MRARVSSISSSASSSAPGLVRLTSRTSSWAIKIHFGELGNLSFLRPTYARAVADVVKELGGKPFLTDCNTLYVGSRKNALEHSTVRIRTASRPTPPAAR